MKYDNLFTNPEEIISHRLRELPGDENMTMKQAGYNSVWTNFLEEFFDGGWGETVKQASLLQIEESFDPFIQGQKEAVDTILEADGDPFVRGWFSFVKEAFDATSGGSSTDEFCKEAQLNLDDELTREEAGFLAASQNVLESDHDLIEIAWNGPNTNTENEQMSAFTLGKEAALDDLAGLVEDGASVQDCLSVISETLEQSLDKQASVEDTDYRLGVEAFCYSFLKEASETYGEFDTSDVDDFTVLEHVLDKVAADGPGMRERFNEATKNLGAKGSTSRKVLIGGGALAAGGTAVGGALAARKGYKAMKARKAEKEKNASLEDPRIQAALAVLEDAGLLDD